MILMIRNSSELDTILEKCTIEEIPDGDVIQPLYIDDGDVVIKCSWCPNWNGSIKTKVINQTAASHRNARKKHLKLDSDTNILGRQVDIHTFLK